MQCGIIAQIDEEDAKEALQTFKCHAEKLSEFADKRRYAQWKKDFEQSKTTVMDLTPLINKLLGSDNGKPILSAYGHTKFQNWAQNIRT